MQTAAGSVLVPSHPQGRKAALVSEPPHGGLNPDKSMSVCHPQR